MRTKDAYELLVTAILNRDNILMFGDPGVGKTDIREQAVAYVKKGIEDGSIPCPSWASEPKVDSITICGVTSDPTDPKGLPWVVVKDGEAKATFLPFGDLERMMQTKGLLIVGLEDFGQAPTLVQASYMQLLLAREINGKRIGEGVLFVVCTNRYGENSGVQGILEPVKDRFLTLIEITASWEDWCEWATTSGRIIPEVIAYQRWRGTNDKANNHLSNFRPTRAMTRSPSPRAWEFVSKTITHGYPTRILREMFCGTVGEEEGNAFHAFLSQYRELVHPDVIIANPEEAEIPTNPSVLWSVLTALAGRANSSNFSSISKYAGRLAPEWSTFLMVECIRREPKLKKTKAYVDWAIAHSDVQI